MITRKFKNKNDRQKNGTTNDDFLGAKVKKLTIKELNTYRGHIYSPNILQN